MLVAHAIRFEQWSSGPNGPGATWTSGSQMVPEEHPHFTPAPARSGRQIAPMFVDDVPVNVFKYHAHILLLFGIFILSINLELTHLARDQT
jgi:hypothetical protein